MSKQIPFGILLTNWIVGLFFVLFAPASVDAAPSVTGKAHLQTSQGFVSDSCNLPDGSTLEFDLGFFQTPEAFRTALYSASVNCVRLYSEYGTVPFFDVKQTFIHFFFTW